MKFLNKKVSCSEDIDSNANKYRKLTYKSMIFIPKKSHSIKKRLRMTSKASKI